MKTLFAIYNRLISQTNLDFKRYLYNVINWDNRLIIIRGARGVGKTTLVLQRIKEAFSETDKAFYASLDNLWFSSHTMLSLVEYLYTHGVTTIFLDEVHKYPNWKQEIKNAYDSYPDLKIVVTGSSMLQLTSSAIGDLSRRARLYDMKGLSFREFLNFEHESDYPVYSLEQIINSHVAISNKIVNNIKIIPEFERYLKHGYYPFYKEEGDGFYERLSRVIETIICEEIPSLSGIEYSSVHKIKHLLSVLAEQTPYTLNVTNLSRTIGTSRDNILKLIDLLAKADITHNLYGDDGFKSLTKPEKILFDNTNIMQALSPEIDEGTMRETFFVSQTSEKHKLIMPSKGDILVDGKFLFEVGGKKKRFDQIKDIDNSFVVSDSIETGFGNRIPIWIFGMLY